MLALMERAFETEKSMFGPIPPTTPKPILVGPELLKWVASKDTKKSEEDHETETQA